MPLIRISTWRAERVVLWKGHLRFEVATVVEGVGVCNDESDDPFRDVIVKELNSLSDMLEVVGSLRHSETCLDVCPGFLGKLFLLAHQVPVRRHVGGNKSFKGEGRLNS